MTILVTGGAGYIGSHTLVELAATGFDFVVLDNLCNSSSVSLQRVEAITGKPVTFVQGDIRDAELLKQVFADYPITAVVHFSGLKAVGESVAQPLRYYDNNVHGSQVLLQAMADVGVFNLVFSSSATVYGDPAEIPISEQCPVGRPTSPYGRSKLMVEDILHDLALSDPRWRVAVLRYFNPVGAHESGSIGEDPNGIPNNLLPLIAQVAVGKLPQLSVFGGDYPTHDGSGVRDYIHVVDLAQGHVAALRYLQSHAQGGIILC
jgi:UDP-glucose 4-epimerase